jgi:Ca2+-binding EF-hand superfamily protein
LANVDRRDLEEIFMPIDPKRTGIVKVDEFESRLMAAQIVLPENTKTVLRTAYTSVGQTNYRKFIKDVILVYPLYADVLGINENQGPSPAVILHEVLRQIFDSHRNLSEYATTIDRGKKGYLNRGDVKTAFEAFKKTISISEQDFDTIYKIINPANDAKILYYKFDEQLTREMEPLLAEMSGRILNGFEVNKEPLGVKVAASGKVKKQWISIPDLITILRAYNEKLLENHIWQLINFLDIPLKNIDQIKYQDFTSTYFIELDKMQIRPLPTLQAFFSSLTSPQALEAETVVGTNASPTSAQARSAVIPQAVRGYIVTLKQKLKIYNEDDALDIFRRIDLDGSGSITQEEFEKVLSHKIPELKKEIITKIFNAFNRNGDNKVTADVFMKVVTAEVPELLDRKAILVDKTAWAEGLLTQMASAAKKNNIDLSKLKDEFDVADVKAQQLYDYVMRRFSMPSMEDKLLKVFAAFYPTRERRTVNVADFAEVLEEYLPQTAGTGLDEFFAAGSPKAKSRGVVSLVSVSRVEALIEEIRTKMRQNPEFSVYALHERLDTDQRGGVELAELYTFLKQFTPSISKAEVKILFDRADRDKNESLSVDEIADFFGLNHIRKDQNLLLNINSKENSKFDNIIKCMNEEIVKKHNMTLDSVFSYTTQSAMNLEDFIKLLKTVCVITPVQPNFQDFMKYLMHKDRPKVVDLTKLKILLDQYLRRNNKDYLKAETPRQNNSLSLDMSPIKPQGASKDKQDLFIFDLLTLFDNHVENVVSAYNPRGDGLITLVEFCDTSKKIFRSPEPPSVFEPIYVGLCHRESEERLTTASFKLLLLGVFMRYNRANERQLSDEDLMRIPGLRKDYSPNRGNIFTFENVEGAENSPISRLADLSPGKQVQLRKLDVLTPEQARQKEIQTVYIKVRDTIQYRDEELIKRLKDMDEKKSNRIHRHYVLNVLKSLDCVLNEKEQELLFEQVAKDGDNILYLDLVSRIFPTKQMVDIKTAHDLVKELTRMQSLRRGTFKQLWAEAKDPDKESMSLVQFKRFLSARGILIADEVIEKIYTEIDTSRDFNVTDVEFKQQFYPAESMTGPKLAIYIRDFLTSLKKTTEDVFKPFADPKTDVLSFAAFANALDSIHLNLRYLDYEVVFDVLDKDKSGSLTMDELKSRLQKFEIKKEVFDTRALRMAMYKLIKSKFSGLNDFLEILDGGKKRYLDMEEFKTMLTSVGLPNLNPEQEIKPMFEAIDVDKDYHLSYKEVAAFYDERTILVLFPFVLQFRECLLTHIRGTKETIFYLVRKHSEGKDILNFNNFKSLCEGIKYDAGGEDNMKIVFTEIDMNNDEGISIAEMRRNLAGEIIDVIALAERVQKIIHSSPVRLEEAFANANSGANDGINFKEFEHMMGMRLGLNISQIEMEELFSFVQSSGQDKIYINEFQSVFGYGHRINPFQYNQKYMESLPEESRKYYVQKYGVMMRGAQPVSGTKGVIKLNAYDQEKDKTFMQGSPFAEENVIGTQAIGSPRSRITPSSSDTSILRLQKVQSASVPPLQMVNDYDRKFVQRLNTRVTDSRPIPEFLVAYNVNGDRKLIMQDIENIMRDVKFSCTEEEKFKIFSSMKPVDNAVPVDHFLKYYQRVMLDIDNSTFNPESSYVLVEKAAVDYMSNTGVSIEDVFRAMQRRSKFGLITQEWEELCALLRLDQSMNSEELEAIFKSLNKAGNGQLSFEEFKAVFRNMTYEERTNAIQNDINQKLVDYLREKCKILEEDKRRQTGSYINYIETELQGRDYKSQGMIEFTDFKNFFVMHGFLRKEDERLNRVCNLFKEQSVPGKIDYMKFLLEMHLINEERVSVALRLRRDKAVDNKVHEFAKSMTQYFILNNIAVTEVFDRYDYGRKDYMDMGDFKKLVKEVDKGVGDYGQLEMESLFNLIDTNNSGRITREEFFSKILPDHYDNYLQNRYKEFHKEYLAINKELFDLRKHDLKSFFNTKENLIPAEDFRRAASSLGVPENSERYFPFLKAFLDQERKQKDGKDMVDIDKMQRLLDKYREYGRPAYAVTPPPPSTYPPTNPPPSAIPDAMRPVSKEERHVQFVEESVEGTNAAARAFPVNRGNGGVNLFDGKPNDYGNSKPMLNQVPPTQGDVYPGNQYPNNQYPNALSPGNQYPGNQIQGNQYPGGNQYQNALPPSNQYPGNNLGPTGGYPNSLQNSNYGAPIGNDFFSTVKPGDNVFRDNRQMAGPQQPRAVGPVTQWVPHLFTSDERMQVKKVVANIVNYLEEDLKQPREIFSVYDFQRADTILVNDMRRALYEDLYIVKDDNCELLIEYYKCGPEKVNLIELYNDIEMFKRAKKNKKIFDLNLVKDAVGANRLSTVPREKLVGFNPVNRDKAQAQKIMDRIQSLKNFFLDKYNFSNFRLFEYLDTNKDNLIVKKEFFSKSIDDGFNGCTRDELDEVFKYIDTNKNGVISLTEFKYYFYDRSYLESDAAKATTQLDEDLGTLFRKMDGGGSGFITCEEVVRCLNILGYPATPEMIEVEFKEYDFDRDNRFDHTEFRRFMHSKMRGTVFRMEHMLDEIKKKFQKVHPKDGQIFDYVQFATGMLAAAPDCTPEEIQAAFFETDQDQTGLVHIDDIIAFVKRPADDRESPLVANAILRMKKQHVLPLKELISVYEKVPRNFCTAFTRTNFLELKNLPSDSLYPRLMGNTLAYHDLFGEYTDQRLGVSYPVKPVDSKIVRTITINLATGVPIPDETNIKRKEMIAARELRAVLFDRSVHKFVGGTVIIPAVWRPEYEDRWFFENEKEATFHVKAHDDTSSLCVLFEFVVFLVHKEVELQMSCCWCSMDVENMNKAGQTTLGLSGGIPSVSMQIHDTDVRTNRSTIMGKVSKFFGGNIKSELKITIGLKEKVPRQTKAALDLMPKTCLVPGEAVGLWRSYRCYAARRAYPGVEVNTSLGQDFIIRTFLRIVNVSSFHRRLCHVWNTHGEPRFNDKNSSSPNYELMIERFEQVMNNISPVFDSEGFRFNKTDQTRELLRGPGHMEERERLVADCLMRAGEILQGDLKTIGANEPKYDRPFDISEMMQDEFDEIEGL